MDGELEEKDHQGGIKRGGENEEGFSRSLSKDRRKRKRKGK